MKDSFQLILLVIFGFSAVIGVLIFSGAIPIGKGDQAGALGTVVMWGTVKADGMLGALEEFNILNPSFVVKYVQKPATTFDADLLEALATGTGPDMILLPDNLAYHYANKLVTIPYTSYPLANFKSTFVGASDVFLTPNGILAFPLTVDPFMLYYNVSMLDTNGITFPPKTWDELVEMVPKLTKKDDTNKILKSTVALGQTSNIANMKDILSTLFLQAGNPIITIRDGSPVPTLAESNSGSGLPLALDFYKSFADPSTQSYSWNKSFPEARDAFGREETAFYFGYGAELVSLIRQNPNQNFFVAPVPQINGSNFNLTMAHVMGIGILSSSRNITTAFTAASLMSSSSFADKFRTSYALSPARRDLLNKKPADMYSPVFYNSALFARSWLDPAPVETKNIFKNMVDAVLSNAMTSDNAIKDAATKMNLLLVK